MTDEPKPPRTPNALDDKSDDPKLKELKARAQLTRFSIKIGHGGINDGVVNEVNAALDRDEIVKVKFVALKDQKKALSRVLEQMTNSLMVQRVGHTATYYRAKK